MPAFRTLAIIFFTLIMSSSCRKQDDFLSDKGATLDFSEKLVLFDTVFVTVGSTTKQLKVYNRNSKPVKIQSLRLASGNASAYRLNVNGLSGKVFSNIEIKDKDSLYIFIEVTVPDPQSPNTPFVLADSIVFTLNGQQQDVDLVAWGQRANFIFPTDTISGLPPYSVVSCNAVWDSLLPYVIYGYAVVDSCTLTISEGTKVHFYNNSGLWVYPGGTLHVEGTKEHPVQFLGTRLDPLYADIPGQWDRIWINEGSIDNRIDYAIIKNGFIGIQTEELLTPLQNTPRKLYLSNTIIKNMSGFGLFSRNYIIDSYNTVIGNCGLGGAALTAGGDYLFRHCTFANYWSYNQRPFPSVYINNYSSDQNGNTVPSNLVNATFGNCIVYGNKESELSLEFTSSAQSNYVFDHTLIKVDNNFNTATPQFINILKNKNPRFVNYSNNIFELDTLSPAKDFGTNTYATGNALFDLKGIMRNLPDLGAFERVE